MDELLEIAEGSELLEKIVNDRLEFEQKITLNWEYHLERELHAQRLENEGISRIEQADRLSEWFDRMHATMESVEVTA